MPERLVTDINHDWICRSTSHFYPDCPWMSGDSNQTNHQHSSTIKNTSKLGRPHNLSCAVTRNFFSNLSLCTAVWALSKARVYNNSATCTFALEAVQCATRVSSLLLLVWLDPVIQSSNPVQNSVYQLEKTHGDVANYHVCIVVHYSIWYF